MNKGKEGANYHYPNSLILPACSPLVHVYLLPYRQLEGFLGVMSMHIKETPSHRTRLHNNLVEASNKDKGKPRSKSKPRKRLYRDSNS